MSEPIQIKGGVGPLEAAAIMAAIRQLLDDEAASKALSPPRDVPTAWVRSGRRRVVLPTRHTSTGLSTREVDDGQII